MSHETLSPSPIVQENLPLPEASEKQLSVAGVNGFFQQLAVIHSMAEEYTLWQDSKGVTAGKPQERQRIKDNSVDIFFGLYFAKDQMEAEKQLEMDYGFDAGPFIRLFRESKPTLDEIAGNAPKNAASITREERVTTLIRETAFAYFNKSNEQKLKLMEIAGISGEEISRYTRSLKLSARILLPLEAAVFAANAAGAAAVFGGIDDPHTQIALALAYAVNTAAVITNSRANLDAVHTSELGYSTNILVTYVYTLVKKQFPDSDFWADASVVILSTLPIVIPEILMGFGIWEGGHGTTAAVARNIMGALNQLIQAGYLYRLKDKAVRDSRQRKD